MTYLRTHRSRFFGTAFQLVLLWGYATAGNAAPCSCGASCDCTVQCNSQGAWFIADSANFQVCSLRSSAEAKLVAHHCEAIRTNLVEAWANDAQAWNPRCQIILYSDVPTYVRAVGRGSETTLASALVKRSKGRIAMRRIDLRSDIADYLTAALPHEMCHVVLADRLPDAPLWLDEGIAIFADPVAKQSLHERDLRLGLERGTAFSAEGLLNLKTYPSAERWGVFYGQSASLVRHLLSRGSADDLVKFVAATNEVGANLALRETYGLSGLQDIERLWRGKNLLASREPGLAVPQRATPLPLVVTWAP
jgi:hypothetical protein